MHCYFISLINISVSRSLCYLHSRCLFLTAKPSSKGKFPQAVQNALPCSSNHTPFAISHSCCFFNKAALYYCLRYMAVGCTLGRVSYCLFLFAVSAQLKFYSPCACAGALHAFSRTLLDFFLKIILSRC